MSLRHFLPHTALALTTATALLHTLAGIHGVLGTGLTTCWITVAVTSYHVGRWNVPLRPAAVLFTAAATATLLLCEVLGIIQGGPRQLLEGLWHWAATTVLLLLAGVGPWLFGRFWRLRTELNTGGWSIAERVERERDVDIERARLRERTRIAAEMHDSLGHDLALIAVRASALEMAHNGDPDQAAAAGELREATHAATSRLSDIVRVLREGGDAPVTRGTDPDITTVIERTSAAGVPVRWLREGPPPDTATEAGRTACRIVQEALTNTMKHAADPRVTVETAQLAAELVVTVRETGGAGQQATAPGHGSGSGLAELRSLVEDLGGTFEAGPGSDGFVVTARLPRDDGATTASAAAQQPDAARKRTEAAHRTRRGLRRLIVVPLALAGVVSVLGAAVNYVVVANSVLSHSEYAGLSTGTPRPEVDRRLPAFQEPDGRSVDQPPVPSGASCQYYPENVWSGEPLYRLCFRDSTLVAKDVVRR
ncbi:histidine kinase [Haloactinospora alba]|uniref:histidine kinase n=2 Tax=Haloactinospora alba TaxID=405555 RepID=A0A543NNC6_9ACTN|nr:histidine kinase [Haloactinospora alba]